MSVPSIVTCVAVILQLWGAHALSQTPACTAPCLCQKTLLLNCSSSSLARVPSHIPTTATSLDLSHNALRSLAPLGSSRVYLRGLQSLWVGNNALESLSLCLGTRKKTQCVSWAPDLQLLCAERNQLKRLPRGLSSIKSLQVLQLSHNRISELGPADLAGCTDLREVHLQHNLINTIDPQTFRDLQKLQTLDLRYNLLTSISIPVYLSLRSLKTLVNISGNRWRCDCNIKTIRRWLSFDSELGNPTWNIECFSPSHHAGKDLLNLKESDLICPAPVYSRPGVQKEVTLDEGAELLLSCINQDFMQSHWWTPLGRVSENQQVLLISNITEQHAGLYVCVSGFQMSLFHLHVRKRAHDTRLRREAPNVLDELKGEENMHIRAVQQVSQDQFVLAVCLSVFITFIGAFVLGVVLRPFLDKLCKKIRTKRDSTSTATNSRTSFTRPRPYVNEGYSEADEDMQDVRVGTRVTFGGVTEVNDNGGSIPYYVTVEDAKSVSSSESIDVDVSYESTQGSESLTNMVETRVEIEDLRSRADSSSETSLREENSKTVDHRHTNAEDSEVVELEPIPDSTELEERSNSSVSLNSGQPQDLQSFYEVNESTEQIVDSPTVTKYDDKAEVLTIPGFTVDPFSERLTESKEESVDDLDPDLWNDSGESFSFTDESPRSSSRVAQLTVFEYPVFQKEMSVDEQSVELRSCNSSESELTQEEQTEYMVNPEEDEESEAYNDPFSGSYDLSEGRVSLKEHDALFEKEDTGTGACVRQDTITLDPSDVQVVFTRGDTFDDEPFSVENECYDSSTVVSFEDEELKQYNVHPVYRTSQKTTTIDSADAGSSSEDEDKQGEYDNYPRRLEIKTETEVNSEHVVPLKNPDNVLNIPFDSSSSSTDKEEKTNKEGERKSGTRLSRLSGLLFNRSGAETDTNAVQPSSKTANKNSGKMGGFLGFSFKKQPMAVDDEDKPNIHEQSFFETVGQVFDQLPKIKKSLLFSKESSEAESVIPETKTQSVRSDSLPEDVFSPTNAADFFGQISPSLNRVPRVKRYLQITPQSSAQSPSTSLKSERVASEFETKSLTGSLDSSSEDELSLMSKTHSFFGQIGASIDRVPKVKRYMQFTQPDAQTTAQFSPSLNEERVTPTLVMTKVHSGRPDSSPKGNLKGDIFFEQVDVSLHGVPKVSRYIKFTQSKPLLSTERVTPELEAGKLNSSSDEINLSSKSDSFFGQIGTSIDGVPKVKRYIQFTQPQSSIRFQPTSLKTERVTAELETKAPPTGFGSSHVDKLSTSTKEDRFFEQMGLSLDKVPKVNRYIQFRQSESKPLTQSSSTSLKTQVVTPQLETKAQSMGSDFLLEDAFSPTSNKTDFFGQISSSVDRVPRVKRYIQFTLPEPQSSAPCQSASLKTESVTPELETIKHPVRLNSSSEDEHSLTSKSDSFFGRIGTSTYIDGVPKVKRYIQFTQSKPQSSAQSLLAPIKTERVPGELEIKTESGGFNSTPENNLSQGPTEDHFFVPINSPLDVVPKVNRYIQFTQSQPQFQFQPSLETSRFGSSYVDKLRPATKGDSFFEQVGLSLDKVPKVNRHIHFRQSELQPAAQFPSTERVAPKFEIKTQSGRIDHSYENDPSPTAMGDNFFVLISTSLDEVPKVKRYIEFTKSEPQSLLHSPSASLNTEQITQHLQAVTQAGRFDYSSKDEVSPATMSGNFFQHIGISLDGVPKVERYIQFSQTECQHSPSLNAEIITEDKFSPTSEHFFEQVDISFNEVPKVNRYIQFTQYKPQTSTLSPPASGQFDSLSEDMVSPTTTSDSFFGQVGASIDGVPKLKRYIQFTQYEPQRSASLNEEMVVPKLHTRIQSGRHDSSSEDKITPASVQVDISFNEVPKVNRYIQFTQYKPQTSTQSPPASGQFDSLFENMVSPTTTSDSFFGQIGASIDGVPKLKRYIQFTQYEPQTSASLNEEMVVPKLHTRIQSGRHDSSSEDKITPASVQVDISFNAVPKVNRYLQFTQTKLQTSTWSSPASLKTERVTPELESKTQAGRFDSLSEDEVCSASTSGNFFGQVDTSLGGVPKVTRYILFTQSESQLSTQSSVSLNEENITPNFVVTKIQSERPDSSSEGRIKPTFFEQVDISFNLVPKVNRYMWFTQSKPETSSQSPSASLNTERIAPDFETKTECGRFNSTPEYNVFGPISTSLDEVPKLKRYIQFTQCQSSVQFPSIQCEGSDSSSEDKFSPNTNGDSFFEQIGTSFDELPVVKRYIQFTESEPFSQPLPPNTGKTKSISNDGTGINWNNSSSEDCSGEHSFIDNHASLDGIPKVKRYIQFTQSAPQPSSPYLHEPIATPIEQYSSSPDDANPNDSDNFFGDTYFNDIPKVKRHIQFTLYESHLLSSSDNAMPSCTEANFFEGMQVSLDSIPKAKRTLHFTLYEPAHQVLSPIERATAEVLTSSSLNNDGRTNYQDSFLGQMDTTPYGVPKVKRYIQFSQTKSYPPTAPKSSSVNIQGVSIKQTRAEDDIKSDFFQSVDASVNTVPKLSRYLKFTKAQSQSLKMESIKPELATKGELKTSCSSPEEKSCSITKEDDLLEQTGISLDVVPKVKRYIQFVQSEPISLNYETRNAQKETKTPGLVTPKDTKSTNIGDFLTQIDVSIDQVPKVGRHVQFTQSELCPSTQMPSRIINTQGVTSVPTTKLERTHRLLSEDELKPSTKADDLLEDMGTSVSGLPKVNRYIQFRQSKPHTQGHEDYITRHVGNINDPQEQNQMQTDSLTQESFDVKVATETTRLDRLQRPKRTLFFSSPNVYGQPDQPLTSPPPVSHSSPGLNAPNSNSKTRLSPLEFETMSESRLSGLSTSSPQTTESHSYFIHSLRMPTRTEQGIMEALGDADLVFKPKSDLDADIALQDANQIFKEIPPALKGIDEAREYLRDSSEARQRQERRRLTFLRKKRAMDGLSLTSQSSESQESDKQGSLSDFEEVVSPSSEHTYHSVSTRRVNDAGYEGMSAKSISSLRYKSARRSDV